MRFLSVCSGIEAASVAWAPLGWKAAAFSEIEPFPCSLLAHHYPSVPNLGDMTRFKEWPDLGSIDLLCGGTPCQSFSVAGLRAGLADPRGNLMLTFGAIAAERRPRWLVWENVPGVLSSNGGRDFGAFLWLLGQLGYGFAYRVLDAQHFGVPQRRRRVFVVGCLGSWQRAAAVLFERHSLSGHPAPSQQARQAVAGSLGAGSARSGGRVGRREAAAGQLIASTGDTAHCLNAGGMGRQDYETETLITHALTGEGFDASEDGTGRGTPLVPHPYTLAIRGRGDSHNLEFRQDGTANALLTPNGGRGGIGVGAIAFQATDYETGAFDQVDVARPLTTSADRSRAAPIAFDCKATQAAERDDGNTPTLRAMNGEKANAGGQLAVAFAETSPALVQGTGGGAGHMHRQKGNEEAVIRQGMQVRRLTPRECERLQGFDDDYTLVPHRGKPAADGPRYKALGNSWAVPCVRWIGERIAAVEAIEQMAAA